MIGLTCLTFVSTIVATTSFAVVDYQLQRAPTFAKIPVLRRLSLTADGGGGDDVLNAAIEALYGESKKPTTVTEDGVSTNDRIQTLVDNHKVLLFMKGSKFFPQCGFSDTATKILERIGCEFKDVDVLADEAIRQGIKEFSQWPTIPQLYVGGEFIGGSDIMLEMFESGELGKLITDE